MAYLFFFAAKLLFLEANTLSGKFLRKYRGISVKACVMMIYARMMP
jgi:hypothetical protein